jgi:hypothetical protein
MNPEEQIAAGQAIYERACLLDVELRKEGKRPPKGWNAYPLLVKQEEVDQVQAWFLNMTRPGMLDDLLPSMRAQFMPPEEVTRLMGNNWVSERWKGRLRCFDLFTEMPLIVGSVLETFGVAPDWFVARAEHTRMVGTGIFRIIEVE